VKLILWITSLLFTYSLWYFAKSFIKSSLYIHFGSFVCSCDDVCSKWCVICLAYCMLYIVSWRTA